MPDVLSAVWAGLLVLAAGLAVATLVLTGRFESRHPPRGTFVAVKGLRLHVVTIEATTPEGRNRPPLVLLHGASGNLEDMRIALADRLAPFAPLILVDRPGHGWSERPRREVGAAPTWQAATLDALLDSLGHERAVLVGHSWSGALAATFALDFPERTAGLVLLAPATHPWPGGIAWYYRLAAHPLIGPLFVRTVVAPVGLMLMRGGEAEVFAPQSPPGGYVEKAAVPLVLRPRPFRSNALDVDGLLAHVTRTAPRYPDIRAPTVVITGDADRVVSPVIHSGPLARQVPGARLVTLPGVGHMPHHVAADLVVAEIASMLAVIEDDAARKAAETLG